MNAQAPIASKHRDNTAFFQNATARHRIRGDLELARLSLNAARAYRFTLPAQSIIET